MLRAVEVVAPHRNHRAVDLARCPSIASLRVALAAARWKIAFIRQHPDNYHAAFADKFVELVDKLDPQSPD